MIPKSIKSALTGGASEAVALLPGAADVAEIARAVCAFLNGNGGSVFCGVGPGGEITGVERGEERAEQLREELQNAITPRGALLSVSVDVEGGKRLLSIGVPAGADKPYVYEGAAYLRKGLRVEPATADALRQMVLASSAAPVRWERRPSMALEEEDLDPEEVRRTVEEAAQARRAEFADASNLRSVLSELGLVQRRQFTNAADVLFGRNPARRHPQVRARATAFKEDKDSDEYLDDKVHEGPLVDMLEQLERFIQRNTRTSVSFGKGLRTDDRPEYPAEAVREGLVNAFAHRDYEAFSGGLAVRLFPGRLEIWNSGRLPEGLKPSDLKLNHSSIPVNPDIVHVLYIRSFMNRLGRGTQNILNACRRAGLREPVWRADELGVKLTLFANHGDAAPGHEGLNERQVALLENLDAGDEVRPAEYRRQYAAGVSVRQARRDLVELESANLLERLGAGAATRYRRTIRTWKGRNRT